MEHDYTIRYWGHDCIFIPDNRGIVGRLSGWGYGIKKGDTVLLENKQNPSGSSLYKISNIKYFSDPPDMFEAKVKFVPRKTKVETI